MLNLIMISILAIFLLVLLFYHKEKSTHTSFIAAFILIGTYLAVSLMQMPFLSTIIIIIIALVMTKLFKIKIKNKIDLGLLGLSVLLGFIFGKVFTLLDEPKTAVVQFIIFALFIAISEELMFRSVILKTLEKEFNFKFALLMQAVLFTIMHIIDLDLLFSHYPNILFLIGYIIALFAFAITTGFMMKGKKANILYPIIIHFIANLILFLA